MNETSPREELNDFCDQMILAVAGISDEDFKESLLTYGVILEGTSNFRLHIVPADMDDDVGEVREVVNMLFSQRRDLLENSLAATNLIEFNRGALELSLWLDHHNFALGMSGVTRISRLQLKLLQWFGVTFSTEGLVFARG